MKPLKDRFTLKRNRSGTFSQCCGTVHAGIHVFDQNAGQGQIRRNHRFKAKGVVLQTVSTAMWAQGVNRAKGVGLAMTSAGGRERESVCVCERVKACTCKMRERLKSQSHRCVGRDECRPRCPYTEGLLPQCAPGAGALHTLRTSGDLPSDNCNHQEASRKEPKRRRSFGEVLATLENKQDRWCACN